VAVPYSYIQPLNDRMINELARECKEVVVPYFDVLSRHSLGSTDKPMKTLKQVVYWTLHKPSSG
jgi:hypothetical protein